MDKVFIDTNILVYTVDKFDKNKQMIARKIIKEAIFNDAAVISTQILQEFYTVLNLAVKRIRIWMSKAGFCAIFMGFIEMLFVIPLHNVELF